MRILLIYPNVNKEVLDWGDTGAIAEPIALEYIGAAAKLDGHDVSFIDLRLYRDQLEETLVEYRPEVIGVTGYSMHVLRCLEVCRIAKNLIPSCKTVVGGHHATIEPVDFFEPQIDYVVVGEGTHPFRKILDTLKKGMTEAKIPGVYSCVDGSYRYGGEQGPFNIDEIPLPDRSLVAADRENYFIDWMKPIALLRTSVGCPFRCSFCSLWRIMNGRYYTRNLDAVVEELRTINEKFVFFVDDELFINAKRMHLLAEKIEKSGIEKEYFAYCRTDSLIKHSELLKHWKGIGLKRLLVGVETIFDQEASLYNKRQKKDQVVQALQVGAKLGIHLLCNFIIHPDYTEKEFDELVRFIQDNGVEHPSFTVWTPLPGTGYPDNEILIRQANGRPDWDYFDLQHPVTRTRLPKEEFVRRFDKLYWLFISKYYTSDSPLTVEVLRKYKAAMKNPFATLAIRALRTAGRAPKKE
ncbi:MAG: radical SAM protein [bacterium]|nr:radical SAM protein [bacterium]